MAFYDLNKEERAETVVLISKELLKELKAGNLKQTTAYAGDEDTYIRKATYLSLGKLYLSEPELGPAMIIAIDTLQEHANFKVRQTAINAAGEIGKSDFNVVRHVFDKGLFDEHHSPRNAVIGSIKKMGDVNPKPVLAWAKTYLHHADKEIRREICHGIELRGRKYPEDILPLLQELEQDQTARVRNTLVHVIGQIAYKKGCLQTVIAHLNTWKNKDLVSDALEEIIDVHERYKDFAVLTQEEAIRYIETHSKK